MGTVCVIGLGAEQSPSRGASFQSLLGESGSTLAALLLVVAVMGRLLKLSK